MEVAEVRVLASINQDAFSLISTGKRADWTGWINHRLAATDGSAVERVHAEIRYRGELDAGAFTDRHAAWTVHELVTWIVIGNANLGQSVPVLEFAVETIVQCESDLWQRNRDEK